MAVSSPELSEAQRLRGYLDLVDPLPGTPDLSASTTKDFIALMDDKTDSSEYDLDLTLSKGND